MIALLLPLHNNLVWDPPVFVRAPEERSLSVEREERALLPVDSRALAIAADPRRLDVPGEARSMAVESENRRLS